MVDAGTRAHGFYLQWFSEEKTEQPTPKKIRDAREKGQVVQSKDLNGAFTLLAVFLAIGALSGFLINRLMGYFIYSISFIEDTEALFTKDGIHALLSETLLFILTLALPLLLIALAVGVGVSYAQVGVLFTTETLKPKLSKINPLKGLKNMFSTKSLVEMLKSIAKASLILYVSISYIQSRLDDLLIALQLDITQTVRLMWEIAFDVILRCAVLLFVIAVLDFLYKKWKNNKELMMTKQEIKEEYKQSEGDPQLKAKIKEKQRAFAMSRMMQEVPKADVVITNPTHFAVAVRYDAALGEAPIVMAKGQDLVAMRIKSIAAEHHVPTVENRELAQALYRGVDIGAFIPIDLYEAVAEVLAFVYSVRDS